MHVDDLRPIDIHGAFANQNEVAAIQRKHARLARDEAACLATTDHEHAEEIAALVAATFAEPKDDRVRIVPGLDDDIVAHAIYDVQGGDAWHAGFDADAYATHVRTIAKGRRYHGIADLVFDSVGRVRGTRKYPKQRRKAVPRRKPRNA